MTSNNLKKAALAAAVAASLGAGSAANASIIDNPVFKVLGAVVVWGGDGLGGATVNDFVVGSGASAIDLIAGDVTPVMTGSLNSFAPSADGMLTLDGVSLDLNTDGVLDAADIFAAFAPNKVLGNSSGLQQSSFYVASNTPFDIKATAVLDGANSSAGASLADIDRTMTIATSGSAGSIAFGGTAQHPHTGGGVSGIAANGGLNGLSDTVVFSGDQRTANAAGSIAEQSVEFTNTYAVSSVGLEAGVSQVAATVTYTIAMP